MQKNKNKLKYMDLCLSEKSIPIFSQHWWLDAVAGKDNWDVALAEEKGEIIASFPFYIKRRMGLKLITMPRLTQKMGIWTKYQDRFGENDKEIINSLLDQIPQFDFFIQDFDYSFSNWLPYYWKNYKQTTMYTYILENIKDQKTIYRNFHTSVKRNIKKAERIVKIRTDLELEDFYNVYKKTFDRQNLSVPNSLEFISRLDHFCNTREARKIFFAEDEQGNIHAAIYLIWDNKSAYYLMGGADPLLRTSGAMSLLIWEAIKYSSAFVNTFDFEGSMIEGIERYFRSFGSVQRPYMRLTKTNSFILKIRNALKELKS